MEQSRRLFLSLAVFGVLTAETSAIAQGNAVRRRDVERSVAGATRMLITVGHWAATDPGGRFYFQFRSNGTYTYTHIDADNVVRAQQAGAFTLREARRVEAGWPRVYGAAGGEGGQAARGLLLRLRPSSIAVQSSDPAELPGDEEAEFRLMFRYESDDEASTPGFELLSASQPPDSEYGHMTFTTGP